MGYYIGIDMGTSSVKLVLTDEAGSVIAEAAQEYGLIRADLKKKGTLIGANDLLIAAHARALGVTLVTNNTREFERVEGLRVENWA